MKMAVGLFVVGCWFGVLGEGGVSFDFEALSRVRFGGNCGRPGTSAPTSVPAYGFVYNSARTESNYGIPAAAVKEHTKWRSEGDVWIVEKDDGMVAACGGNVEAASFALASWQSVFGLADASGGVYRLSFEYKMNHSLGEKGGCAVRLGAGRWMTVNEQLEDCDSEWKNFTVSFPVGAGVTNVQVNLNHSGVGMLCYRGLSLVREECATPVVLTMGAHGQVDKSFAVGSGQVGCITYLWKRRAGETFDWKKFTFRLTLPKGFRFVAANWVKGGGKELASCEVSSYRVAGGRGRPPLPGKELSSCELSSCELSSCEVSSCGLPSCQVIELPTKGEVPPTDYSGSNWSRFGVLVRSAGDCAAAGIGTFEALYDGVRVSNVETTRWFTIAPVRVARKPKRYRNGFFPGSGYGEFADPAATLAFAQMASDAGMDWWIPQRAPSKELLALYRAAGISVVTPQIGGLRDGYVVNGGASYYPDAAHLPPEEDRYRTRAATSDRTVLSAVCPLSVIEERAWFRTNTVPRMAAQVAGVDGIWANWEPYSFIGKGCMCERCRKKFAAFVKVPEEEMTREVWWKEAQAGGKHAAENRRFRSRQHGAMIRVIDRYVRAATGGAKSVGFIPGIAWCEMSSFWRANDYPPEAKAIEYAGALEWIDPWGPYPFWNLNGTFAQREGFNVVYWLAAKDVREQVNRDYPAGARPKLLAFPQGAQSCEWITEPEWLGLGLDSFFFNGWEASVGYFFPKGYDARYWRAVAEATARAAKYEDFVYDGRRCDGEVSVKTPGFGQVYRGRVTKYLAAADVSLVQHAAYERGGRLIVAVLNFSDTRAADVEISHARYGAAKGRVAPDRCVVFELGEKGR